jgi:hypothetical protein
MPFTLPAPDYAVIGATDIERMALFLASLGMYPGRRWAVDAASAATLYGLPSATEVLELSSPFSTRRLRIVGTPNAAEPFAPLRSGPYGLDFFSRDIGTTVAMTRAAGGHNYSDLVPYGDEVDLMGSGEAGKNAPDPDKVNYEILFQGPDELTVYVTDVARSENDTSPVLAEHADIVNSELIMACWVIEEPDRERAFWEGEAQFQTLYDGFAGNDAMVALMYHPRPTPLRCNVISGRPRGTQIELMSYPEERLTGQSTWPLRGGLFAVGVEVDQLDDAVAALHSVNFSATTTGPDGTRFATGTTPAGVRIELAQR